MRPLRPLPAPRPRPSIVATLGIALAASPGLAPAVAAQAPVPATIDACYVPSSGTVYRINTTASPAPGAPPACIGQTHVRFTWHQQGPVGPAGPKGERGDPGEKGEPGAPATIGPDLALAGALAVGGASTFNGASRFESGLLATGGTLTPPSGNGTRFMWVPQKAALRAGAVLATEWDEASIGFGSIALGTMIVADGDRSTAIGYNASTNGKHGAFVYGDGAGGRTAAAQVDHEFLVRARGGVRLRTSPDMASGCDVTTEGRLSCSGGVSMSAGMSRTTGAWISVGTASSSGYQSLACPTGFSIVGGGVETDGGDMKVRMSYPEYESDRWYAITRNDHAFNGGRMRLFAVCLRD